jgi:hypothetical protein
MNGGNVPVIRHTSDFTGRCKTKAGVKVLHRIHRTLPPFILQNSDPEVLQDEAGAPILDETTDGYIYDTLVNGGQFQS